MSRFPTPELDDMSDLFIDAISSTTNSAGWEEHIIKRMKCCILICCMPSEGLDEALTSLTEMREFYLQPLETLSLPPATYHGTGSIGRIAPPPELTISE